MGTAGEFTNTKTNICAESETCSQLITVKKTTTAKFAPPTFEPAANPDVENEEAAHVPAHKDFREKYFQGFRKEDPTDPVPLH